MSLLLGTTLLAGPATNTISNAHSLLDFKWTDHILNEMSWLRADTFSWHNGNVYVGAYNHLVGDFDSYWSDKDPNDPDNWFHETIGSNTIWYTLSADGHKIVLTDHEDTAARIYNEVGVSWYYILDKTNKRFKLPRTKFGFVGIRDKVGKFVEAGLPNITGRMGVINDIGGIATDGAFHIQTTSIGGVGVDTASSAGWSYRLDASRSSSVYGNSDTVQQKSTQMYLYFYVGNFSQSAAEQTAGITTEELNDKLDLDASNATSITKNTINGWGMPNYSAGISIAVPKSSTPYTAPYNGVYKLSYENRSGVNGKYLTVNGVLVYRYQYSTGANPGWLCSIELKKGDVLSANVDDAPTTIFYSVFYPYVGG